MCPWKGFLRIWAGRGDFFCSTLATHCWRIQTKTSLEMFVQWKPTEEQTHVHVNTSSRFMILLRWYKYECLRCWRITAQLPHIHRPVQTGPAWRGKWGRRLLMEPEFWSPWCEGSRKGQMPVTQPANFVCTLLYVLCPIQHPWLKKDPW